jgi:beta-lactamase class A
MGVVDVFAEVGVTGTACAMSLADGWAVGHDENIQVTPASVMKVQVAVAVEAAIASGALDGGARRVLSPTRRTPGPVGISLLDDELTISIRDLVVLMLTISDNAATDELIELVGLDPVNSMSRRLGLADTHIVSDLHTMLDEMAADAGFPDYATLAQHDPARDGPPSDDEVRVRLGSSRALDPARGSRTTAADTVLLLQNIWADTAAPAIACSSVRRSMHQQLTRHRIASGFGPDVRVAAKSGGLMGVVRNEAGVVTFPDGHAYAVAVFTRSDPRMQADATSIDAGIGRVARLMVERLRA